MAKKKARAKPRKKPAPATVSVDQLELENVQESFRTHSFTHGIRTGLGIRKFMEALFIRNETTRGKRLKLTNAALERAVRNEFPDRESVLNTTDGNGQTLSYYRHLYNQGKLYTYQGTPKWVSVRYNNEGEIVDTRQGKRILTAEDLRKICEKYNVRDPRWWPE